MRLYLSSFRLGNQPTAMLSLINGTRVAVIANADDYKTPADRAASVDRECADLLGLDLAPTEVDLREYFDQPARLASDLQGYDLLWVRGGNAFILRRALRASGADQVLTTLLAEDAIAYAGYSAAATVLTPSLAGVDLVDDPTDVPDGYSADVPAQGLGVLPYTIVPHYKSDHPESSVINDYLEYLVDHHMPFIALRDGEALVRHGDRESVVS